MTFDFDTDQVGTEVGTGAVLTFITLDFAGTVGSGVFAAAYKEDAVASAEFPTTPGAFAAAYKEGAGASTEMLSLTGEQHTKRARQSLNQT